MKVFFVLVSFLVINFNLLGCSLGQQIAEPVIYLMPEGYMGNVYIFHDVPDGFPLKREDRARVYEIPKDGIFCKKNFY